MEGAVRGLARNPERDTRAPPLYPSAACSHKVSSYATAAQRRRSSTHATASTTHRSSCDADTARRTARVWRRSPTAQRRAPWRAKAGRGVAASNGCPGAGTCQHHGNRHRGQGHKPSLSHARHSSSGVYHVTRNVATRMVRCGYPTLPRARQVQPHCTCAREQHAGDEPGPAPDAQPRRKVSKLCGRRRLSLVD